MWPLGALARGRRVVPAENEEADDNYDEQLRDVEGAAAVGHERRWAADAASGLDLWRRVGGEDRYGSVGGGWSRRRRFWDADAVSNVVLGWEG